MPTAGNGTTLDPDLSTVDVSKLKVLTVEDILSADDIRRRDIAVEEWGGKVVVQSLTKAKEFQIRVEAGGVENLDHELFEMLMFIHGVVEPEFTKDHAELLKAKSSAPFDRVLKAVLDISGLTEGAKDKAKSTFPTKA